MEKSQMEKRTLWKLNGYVIQRSDVEFIAFDENYVYNISSNSLETILQFLKG